MQILVVLTPWKGVSSRSRLASYPSMMLRSWMPCSAVAQGQTWGPDKTRRDYTSRNSLDVVDTCRSFANRVFTRGCERMCRLLDDILYSRHGFPGRELSTLAMRLARIRCGDPNVDSVSSNVITRLIKIGCIIAITCYIHGYLGLPLKCMCRDNGSNQSHPATISPESDVKHTTSISQPTRAVL